MERSVSPVEHQSRKSDIHDKRRLSQGDSETPKITDNMSDTSDQFEKAIFKKKRLSCRSKASKDKEVNVVPSHLPFKDKIDTELEGDVSNFYISILMGTICLPVIFFKNRLPSAKY